jgi:hypothetical protein
LSEELQNDLRDNAMSTVTYAISYYLDFENPEPLLELMRNRTAPLSPADLSEAILGDANDPRRNRFTNELAVKGAQKAASGLLGLPQQDPATRSGGK